MKKTIFMGMLALSMAFVACNKEDDPVFNAQSAKISSEIDKIADDVSAIAEQQYDEQQAAAGRPDNVQAFLPSCATVTTTFTDDSWTSVVSFGSSGCTLDNGSIVTGDIIVTGSTDFTQTPYEVNYSFSNFYHNDRHVEGTRHVAFTWQSTAAQTDAHTVADIDLDFTVTYPNGNVYHRNGHRVRELIEGYGTPFIWLDNVYQVTGSWTTTFPSGTLTTTISDPLIYHASCPWIGSGVLSFSTDSNTASFDYGDGSCDYFATLVINNGSPSTVLLN